MMYYTLLVSCAIITGLLFLRLQIWYGRSKLAQLHGCKSPRKYPQRDPFFGLDFVVGEFKALKAHRYLEEQKRQHKHLGNTFLVTHLFGRMIYTIEPENLRTILATNFGEWGIDSRRKTAFTPLLGESIFLKDGPEWEAQGSLLRPFFYKTQEMFLEKAHVHVENLLQLISNNSSVVDLGPLFQHQCADVSSDFLFGQSVNLLKESASEGHRVIQAIHKVLSLGELQWILGSLGFLLNGSTLTANIKIVHQYFRRYVQDVLQHGERSASVSSSNQPPEGQARSLLEKFSHKVHDSKYLHDEMFGLFLAGTDSTAALLTNLMFELSRQPNLWNRLRQEVAVLEGRPPRLQEIDSFGLVSNCVAESLRLHPVAPSNTRVARVDTVLPVGGGEDGLAPILVPAGTMVHLNMYALHRREDLWGTDAEVYRPDRWTDHKQTWKFLPFLRGPRGCPGREFALLEATYTLIRLVQTCKTLISADHKPWTESISLFCSSRNGARVTVSIEGEDVI